MPIDSWAPDWYLQQQPAIEVVCPPADLDPYLETYHDMIMHCVQADVQAVSNKLGISKGIHHPTFQFHAENNSFNCFLP